jgi:beta-lactam-binding protein with PASTA domain
MNISGRAGIAIGAAIILTLGTAGGVSYALVNSSGSQPAPPIATAPLAPHAKIPTHTKWGKTLRVRHTQGRLAGGSVIILLGPRVSSQTGASRQAAEIIDRNQVAIVTLVWINITTIQMIIWPDHPGSPIITVPGGTTKTGGGTGTAKTGGGGTTTHTPPLTRIAIPNEAGRDQTTAQNDLATAGFTNVVVVGVRGPDGSMTGSVLDQNPAPGTLLLSGGKITLTVVTGIQVPAEVGNPVTTAQGELSSAGFTNVTVNMVPDPSGVSPGNVVSQTPASTGITMALAGDPITLNVASGSTPPSAQPSQPTPPPANPTPPPANPTPPPAAPAQPPAPQQIAVPNEVGNDVNTAQSDLSSAGFTNVIVNTVPGPIGTASGTVLSQSPAAGAMALPGDMITLTVAQ